MSEKLDGVRAYWDGSNLISRNMKVIITPNWFTEKLPKIPLDGELWMGRSKFEQLLALLGSKDLENSTWNDVTYNIFDLPASSKPFSQRLKQMKQIQEILPPHTKIIENMECKSMEHLHDYLDSIVEQGGEGVMTRDPHAKYISGITSTLLKVKVN